MFGKEIDFTFKKQKYFRTYCGAVVSVFCFMLILLFVVLRSQKLISKEDPFFAMTDLAVKDGYVDLWQ